MFILLKCLICSVSAQEDALMSSCIPIPKAAKLYKQLTRLSCLIVFVPCSYRALAVLVNRNIIDLFAPSTLFMMLGFCEYA